ncbi:MAG: MMPL family transporter [Deltaproteobacteria bacterium]|nr:MMPL family transporter [Deltaproteobacteria bacterium]
MNRFIRFAIRHPIPVFIILALITVILAPGMLKLKIDNSIETIMPKHDSKYIFYNKLKETYGDNGQFVVMAVSADDLWSPVTIRKFHELLRDIEEFKDFSFQSEKKRLQRLTEITTGVHISGAELSAAFTDAPPFRRLLERKITKLFGTKKILTTKNLQKLRAEIERVTALKQEEFIDEIVSPLTMKDIKGAEDTLEVVDLIEEDEEGNRILPETGEDITSFRKRLERNPSFENALYSRDPVTEEISDFGVIIKFINVEDRDPVARELIEIIEGHRDLRIVSTGMPIVYVRVVNYIRSDFIVLVPLVMLVVMAVFYINFRTVRGVILPLASLSLAELWLLGLMGHLGFKITVMASSLPTLMIAVGSSYAIHILNQYYADFDMITAAGKEEGLRVSMTHISLTVLLAGLTTFIAFMTLVPSQLSCVREWGFFSAIGALFAVITASSLIPASLSMLPHERPQGLWNRRKQPRVTIVDRIIALMARGAIRHHRKVVVAIVIILVISIAGFLQLEVDTAYVSYFKKGSSVRKDINTIGEKFGGGWGFDILINSGSVDGVKSPEFLNALEAFRNWLETDENRDLKIGRTDSFSDFIKTMHMAMNNDDPAAYAIPTNRTDIQDYLEIYAGDDDDSDGRFDEFEPFVDIDYRTCDLLARLCRKEGQPVGTAEIDAIGKRISGYLDRNLPPGASYTISGFPIIEVQVSHYLITGQLQSLILSLVVVDIIAILLFQHFAAGLLALIPMGVAVLINFGIMGWLGIALDMPTSVIAAVTIGIGVDDTIHFLNNFRHNRARGYGVDETIERTLAVTGKAIIFTSLALICGFFVFLLSSFIPIMLLGILLAITMTATTVGALLILPSVIKASRVDLSEPARETWMGRYLNIGKWFGLGEEEYGTNNVSLQDGLSSLPPENPGDGSTMSKD